MESILASIRKYLGPSETYRVFDDELIMCINSAFSILTQLGVGPKEGFSIKDENDLWEDYLQDSQKLEFVKSYIQAKVKLLFDPPNNSSLIDSSNRILSELEWRINVAVDPETEV